MKAGYRCYFCVLYTCMSIHGILGGLIQAELGFMPFDKGWILELCKWQMVHQTAYTNMYSIGKILNWLQRYLTFFREIDLYTVSRCDCRRYWVITLFCNMITKCRDYVYGIWQYKALGTKRYFPPYDVIIYPCSQYLVWTQISPWTMTLWAPSQYKDRLSQVWGFPC